MGEYLVWSNEHSAWWRPDQCGYTWHLSSAGRYSRDEALAICKSARGGRRYNANPSEVPILLADAEAFWTDEGLAERQAAERDEDHRRAEQEVATGFTEDDFA